MGEVSRSLALKQRRQMWPNPERARLRNRNLNQIIFSYGIFNRLLFYSLAIPRIYCGSGGFAVSHLGRFP